MVKNSVKVYLGSAISKGDYEGFLAFCTDDVIWTFVGDQILRGKEEVQQYMTKTYLEQLNFSVEIIVAESEFVTAVGKIRVKNQTAQSSDYSYCDIWRFENKKMAELKAFVVPINS